MNDLDQRLSHQLHDLAEGEPGTTPPTDRLLARGRRARHRRAALASTSLAVIAAAAITGVAVATHSSAVSATADRRPATTTAADPRLELAAAIANSQNVSFTLKTKEVFGKGVGSTISHEATITTERAYDPAANSGYLRYSDGIELRLINGVLYVNSNNQWIQNRGTFTSLDWNERGLHDQLTASADSQELLRVLRNGDAKVTKTGERTYHFELTGTADGAAIKQVGDVTLDADKRVAKVTYDWRKTYAGSFQHEVSTMEFSGYGTPVAVETPVGAILDR
jgi:hypothetical protein